METKTGVRPPDNVEVLDDRRVRIWVKGAPGVLQAYLRSTDISPAEADRRPEMCAPMKWTLSVYSKKRHGKGQIIFHELFNGRWVPRTNWKEIACRYTAIGEGRRLMDALYWCAMMMNEGRLDAPAFIDSAQFGMASFYVKGERVDLVIRPGEHVTFKDGNTSVAVRGK